MASNLDNLLRMQIRMETKLPKIVRAEVEPSPQNKLPGRRHYAGQFSESFYGDIMNSTLGRRHFGRIQHSENEECIHRERKHYMPTVHEGLRDQTNIRGWDNASSRKRSPQALGSEYNQ